MLRLLAIVGRVNQSRCLCVPFWLQVRSQDAFDFLPLIFVIHVNVVPFGWPLLLLLCCSFLLIFFQQTAFGCVALVVTMLPQAHQSLVYWFSTLKPNLSSQRPSSSQSEALLSRLNATYNARREGNSRLLVLRIMLAELDPDKNNYRVVVLWQARPSSDGPWQSVILIKYFPL